MPVALVIPWTTATRWNPWPELRARDHLIFGVCDLPPRINGLYIPDRPHAFVMVSRLLNKSWRNAVLAHELVHDERGGGCVLAGMPESWRAIAMREEQRVWDIVASRLVPQPELVEIATLAELNSLTLERWQIAEHFDVPQFLAERRLELPDLSGRKVA